MLRPEREGGGDTYDSNYEAAHLCNVSQCFFWSHFSNEGMKKRGRRSCFQAFSQGSWGAKRERERGGGGKS